MDWAHQYVGLFYLSVKEKTPLLHTLIHVIVAIRLCLDILSLYFATVHARGSTLYNNVTCDVQAMYYYSSIYAYIYKLLYMYT